MAARKRLPTEASAISFKIALSSAEVPDSEEYEAFVEDCQRLLRNDDYIPQILGHQLAQLILEHKPMSWNARAPLWTIWSMWI